MAYKALYRKYRPTTFSDVVGQEHITETLKAGVASGKIFHAYLFTGTRGTGKTSCAKILAKAVNCLNPVNGDPCCECEICREIADTSAIDVVEIDAASNNSVEDIRELRDRLSFTPAKTKYRVYIIDEVHMLSISAFNALLKTLEEPPPYVIFILATTEVHKLPATILSRCQRFDFNRISSENIVARIKQIAEKEQFSITDSAAETIAAFADGGMRDALSILDLCVCASKKIDDETVEKVLGTAGNDYILKLAEQIRTQDLENALLTIDKLYSTSVDMSRLLSELIEHYRNLMIVKTVKGKSRPIICSAKHLQQLEQQAENYGIKEILFTLDILKQTVSKMQNGSRRCEMEMLLVRLCTPGAGHDISDLERRISRLENGTAAVNTSVKTNEKPKEIPTETINTPQNTDDFDEDIPDISKSVPPPDDSDTAPTADGKLGSEKWGDILSVLSKSAPLISGILAGSNAYISGDFLLIDAPNPQFAELINGKNNIYREKLRQAIETVTGKTYKLGPYKKRTETVQSDPLLAFKNKLDNLTNNTYKGE